MNINATVSTQEAATILNVSQAHIINLLKDGEILHPKSDTHQGILLQDLLSYKEKLQKTRRTNLDSLAKKAQYLNLGYE